MTPTGKLKPLRISTKPEIGGARRTGKNEASRVLTVMINSKLRMNSKIIRSIVKSKVGHFYASENMYHKANHFLANFNFLF